MSIVRQTGPVNPEMQPSGSVLLQVGHRLRSAAAFSDQHFVNGRQYVGLELPVAEKGFGYATQADVDRYRQLVRQKRAGEQVSFIQGDGAQMPFFPETVDTVFAANLANIADLSWEAEAFDALFLGMRQVLKPAGSVILFQDAFPNFDWPTVMRLEDRLGFLGLRPVETLFYESRPTDFLAQRARFGMQTGIGIVSEGQLDAAKDAELQRLVYRGRYDQPAAKDSFLILSKTSGDPAVVPGRTPHSEEMLYRRDHPLYTPGPAAQALARLLRRMRGQGSS